MWPWALVLLRSRWGCGAPAVSPEAWGGTEFWLLSALGQRSGGQRGRGLGSGWPEQPEAGRQSPGGQRGVRQRHGLPPGQSLFFTKRFPNNSFPLRTLKPHDIKTWVLGFFVAGGEKDPVLWLSPFPPGFEKRGIWAGVVTYYYVNVFLVSVICHVSVLCRNTYIDIMLMWLHFDCALLSRLCL